MGGKDGSPGVQTTWKQELFAVMMLITLALAIGGSVWFIDWATH